MPRVSAEHLEARRFGILKAALRCFSRNGLHATSMKDICRAANLSPGAVYRYFPSKEAIVEALAELARRRIGDFLEGLESAEPPATATGTLADRLEALCGALERPENLESMRLDVVMWAEALRLPEVRATYLRGAAALRRSIATLVLDGQAVGVVDPEADPEAVARLFQALFEGLALQKVLEPDRDLGPTLATARHLLGRLTA